MNVKEFCQKAIENGHGKQKSGLCEGWDWIKANLAELDNIFQTPEYKAKNGMKCDCMPLLVGSETLTEQEEDALGTAWYLNNDRQREINRLEYRSKMLSDGWLLLTIDVFEAAVKAGKNLLLSATRTSDWLTTGISGLYRPHLDDKGNQFLLAPRCRRRGYFLQTLTEHGNKDAFCKIV